MTAIETAIKQALDAGWDDTNYAFASRPTEFDMPKVGASQYGKDLCLDPAFWKALGKARDWEGIAQYDVKERVDDDTSFHFTTEMAVWQHQMHRLIDHLADGREPESFFAAL